MQSKESLKTVSLGTSKINYLDPRITVAWCKMHEVPIEKIYTRVLLDKFNVRLGCVTAVPSASATDVARTRSGPWRRSPLSTFERKKGHWGGDGSVDTELPRARLHQMSVSLRGTLTIARTISFSAARPGAIAGRCLARPRLQGLAPSCE